VERTGRERRAISGFRSGPPFTTTLDDMSMLTRFLPNELNRKLFPIFLCFCIAVVAAALGFAADAFQFHMLGQAAFLICATGVIAGCVLIVWRIATLKSEADS